MREAQHGKIRETIRERVASVLEFGLQDPRRSNLTITVTRVELASDLSRATVFYSVLGDDKARTLAAHMLKHATGFIRTEVAKSLQTRKHPQIEFRYDDSIEKSVALSKRIEEVAAEDRRIALEREKASGNANPPITS